MGSWVRVHCPCASCGGGCRSRKHASLSVEIAKECSSRPLKLKLDIGRYEHGASSPPPSLHMAKNRRRLRRNFLLPLPRTGFEFLLFQCSQLISAFSKVGWGVGSLVMLLFLGDNRKIRTRSSVLGCQRGKDQHLINKD